jgi:hypothetical protein
MKTITNKFKIALVAVGMLAAGTVSAQITDATNTTLNKDADATKVVKLVDNKGTIKYIQSKNGITQITSTVAGNQTVTTWQLGGILEDNTYITADAAKEFALDGLELVANTGTNASTNSVDREAHGNVGTGFTVLIRDEATGAVQKMLLSELLQVDAVRVDYSQVADATGAADATLAIPVAGLPLLTTLTTMGKLFVFRNGVKLRSGTDFVATAGIVTITYNATDLPMYAGDIIEIQYIK